MPAGRAQEGGPTLVEELVVGPTRAAAQLRLPAACILELRHGAVRRVVGERYRALGQPRLAPVRDEGAATRLREEEVAAVIVGLDGRLNGRRLRWLEAREQRVAQPELRRDGRLALGRLALGRKLGRKLIHRLGRRLGCDRPGRHAGRIRLWWVMVEVKVGVGGAVVGAGDTAGSEMSAALVPGWCAVAATSEGGGGVGAG